MSAIIEKLKASASKRLPAKLAFIALGLLSTLWFLVRVIPKPSRATYPCMQAAAPFMSAFIIYILGLSGSVLVFKKARSWFRKSHYLAATALFLTALGMAAVGLLKPYEPVYANPGLLQDSNTPIGEAKGINPGRVAWSWEPDATNEDCSNEYGDAYDLPENTDLVVVEAMCSDAITGLVGTDDISEAWDTLFRYFNKEHGKGAVPYSEGEKIFIKMNFVGGHRSRMNDDHSRNESKFYGNSQASPQVGLAILRQLINGYGIPQEAISIGDPSKNIYKNTWDMWTSEFPNVTYIAELDELGRTMAVPGEEPAIFYSDRGTVLDVTEDYLCSALEDADYLINISALKGHERAGITLNAKNHYGSHMSPNASHLHPGLVGYSAESKGYGKYRTPVDLMGHEQLGGKTLLFVIDGLWSGPDANLQPVKWKMAPFSDDWTSSIFMSQDHVAMESVCYDFLRNEYTADNSDYPYPQMEGTEDYLMQAADSTYWPEDFIYDPENDGTPMECMGVFEIWNNPVDMEYTRNLGTGDGIELLKIFRVQSPMAPRNLDYVLLSDTEAKLSWDKSNGNTNAYILEQSVGNTHNFQEIALLDSSITSYEVSGSYTSTMYYYRVKAVSASVSSGYSMSVEICTAYPSAPVNLSGEVLDASRIRISWEAGSSVEQYYAIERAQTMPNFFSPLDTVSADLLEYVSENLNASTNYFFRIKALNGDFESDFSASVQIRTSATSILSSAADATKLALFPNPFREQCTLRLQNPYLGPVQIKVFKLDGSLLHFRTIYKYSEQQTHQLEGDLLPAGAFLLEVSCGNERIVKQIVKEK